MSKKIFFVANDNSNFCNCFKMFNLVNTKSIFSRIKYQLIFDNTPDYSYYNKEKNLVVLFGINKVNNSSYIITTKKNPIASNWFVNKIKYAIFFMPEGAELFNEQNWSNMFDGWVTFKSKYEFLTDDLRILNDKMPLFYKKMFKTLVNVPTPRLAYDKILKNYDEAIKDFLDKKSILKYKNIGEIKMSVYKLAINQQNLIYKE